MNRFHFTCIRMIGFLLPAALSLMLHAQVSIKGRVLQEAEQKPVAGVQITIIPTGQKATSDSSGKFILEFPAKARSLTFFKEGFEPLTIDIKNSEKPVTVYMTPSNIQLQEHIEVRGVPLDNRIQKTIPKSDINRLCLTTTPDQLLADVAGIDIKRTSVGSNKGGAVTIRGFDESRSLILLNGRPLNGSGVMGGDYVDWSSLSSEDIDKIEVIHGAKTAEFGNTLGGVVNIITRPLDQTSQTHIGATYGSTNTMNASISDRRSIKNFLAYQFTVSNGANDGYLRNNSLNRWSFSGNMDIFLPGGFTLNLAGKYTSQRLGFVVENNPENSYYNPDYPESLAEAGGGPALQFKGGDSAWGDGSYWRNIRQQYDIKLEKSWNNLDLEASFFVNDQDRNEFFYSAADPGRLIVERYAKPEDMTWGWMIKARHTLKNHLLKYGLDGIHLRYGGGEIRQIDPDYFTVKPVMSLETVNAVRRHSLFVQDTWSLGNRWVIDLGGRYDYYQGMSQLANGVPQVIRQGFSPKLGIAFVPWKQGQLNFYASKGYRFPTCPEFYWFYSGFQPENRLPLAPENALQLEAGFSQEFGQRFGFEFRIYRYHVRDYLRTIFGYRPSRVVYNIDWARLTGLEVELHGRIFKGVSGYANATYQSTRKQGDILDQSSQLSDKLSELPAIKGNGGLRLQLDNNARFDLRVRLVGNRSVLIGNLASATNIQLVEMAAFTTVSFNMTWPLWQKNSFLLRWQLAAENLFNKSYQEIYGFPMPGRTILTGLDIVF